MKKGSVKAKIVKKKTCRLICDDCGSSFARKSILRRHIEAQHLNLKPFQCEICLKFFAHKKILQKHINRDDKSALFSSQGHRIINQVLFGLLYPCQDVGSIQKIVFCWNNCSGYSQEKCFKCNLVFPKLSRLKKGQQVKGF